MIQPNPTLDANAPRDIADVRDLLEQMFFMQRDLMRRYGYEEPSCDAAQDAYLPWLYRHVQELCTCVGQEAAELRDWTPWKKWSKRLGNKSAVEPGSPAHLAEIDFEIIDIFHFTLELCIVRGITPQRLYQVYAEKNEINHQRQDGGGY